MQYIVSCNSAETDHQERFHKSIQPINSVLNSRTGLFVVKNYPNLMISSTFFLEQSRAGQLVKLYFWLNSLKSKLLLEMLININMF